MSINEQYNKQSNKYNVSLENFNISSMIKNGCKHAVDGTCDFILEGNITEQNTTKMPNFNKPITGKLEVDEDIETIEIKGDIPIEEVKKQIMQYITEHGHAHTSDFVFDLGIDPELIVKALNILEEENLVEGKPIQPSPE